MRYVRNFGLWILPLLGLVLGLAYAHIYFNGLLKSWHFVGQPDEVIVEILGIKEGRKLVVATETGKIYSLGFHDGDKVALPAQFAWEKEQLDSVDAISGRDWGTDFITLPPPFQVEQLYEHEYLYKVEGKAEVRFALTADGNLWMWNHQIAGLTSLVFYFYPVIGFLVGSAVALLIAGVIWLNGKVQQLNQPEFG